jgi:hypothetical protein
MTPYEVFGIYHSLKLHFTQESFDFHKYNGKSKISLDAFDKRKDKWHFAKLARKFNDREDCIFFIVANLLDDNQKWVGNLLLDEADTIHKERMKVVQSLSYVFENDCRKLFEGVEKPNELLKVVNGDYPVLLTKTMQKVTQIETFCLLSKILGFLPMWKEKIGDTIVWPNFYMRSLKYSSFLPKDEMKYKIILKKVLSA